jgi:hypothetical protein
MEPYAHSWRKWLVITSALLAVFLPSDARAVVLEWDPNSEVVAGYRVYLGEASRSYGTTYNVGNQTNIEIAPLQPGKTFYFAVTAYDTNGLESDFSQEVFYTVPIPNHPPVTSPDAYTTMRNQTLTRASDTGVLANDSDADGDALSVLLVNAPAHGALTLTVNGGLSYTPNSNFTGTDSFSYQITDGKSTSSVTMVTLTVNAPPPPPPENQTPVATADAYEGLQNLTLYVDAARGLLANDTDADGDPLRVLLLAPSSDGLLTLQSEGSFTFQPANDFTGTAQFSYCATDGNSTSAIATVTLTITMPPATNQVPVAVADSYVTGQNQTLIAEVTAGVLTNDTDMDGDPLTAVLIMPAAHGEVSLTEDGSFTYVPATNYIGSDSFSYAATDTKGASSTGVVLIVVTAPPQECSECSRRIVEFFIAHDGRLPRRKVALTEGNCLYLTAKRLERAARVFRKNPAAAVELLEIGECLSGAMESRAAEQRVRMSTMYPSSWRIAASNALNSLPIQATGQNPLLIARSLVRRAKALHRIDRFIARGTVAPQSLDGRIFAVRLVQDGVRERFTITFTNGAWLTTAAVRTLNVASGPYDFQQTAWNRGALELGSESGNTLALQLRFRRTRAAVSGAQVQGWFFNR